MKSYLCIDYGEKRIGLALADTPIAEPYKIIDADNAISTIKQICDQKEITDIVVGISEAKTKEDTQTFILDLKKTINLPIYTQDETMTTHEVKQHFLDTGVSKEKTHGYIDHFSAALILQDFLDEQ